MTLQFPLDQNTIRPPVHTSEKEAYRLMMDQVSAEDAPVPYLCAARLIAPGTLVHSLEYGMDPLLGTPESRVQAFHEAFGHALSFFKEMKQNHYTPRITIAGGYNTKDDHTTDSIRTFRDSPYQLSIGPETFWMQIPPSYEDTQLLRIFSEGEQDASDIKRHQSWLLEAHKDIMKALRGESE